MQKIVLMGECMLELRQAKDGLMNQSFAGDTFNTAVYMKRTFAQQDIAFMTAVGQDTISQQMVSRCSSENLNNQHIFAKSDRNPGIYLVQTDEQGERSFLYWRDSSAAKQVMQYVDQAAIDELCKADLFFFSGISIAILEPQDRDAFWAMLEQLKKAGVKIGFDPNYRRRLWNSADEAKAEFAKAYAASDIMMPGVDDFKQLYDIESLEDILAFCQPFGIAELVLKNGPESVYCQLDGQLTHVAITPVTNVVDTTSAGDSFNGVYLGARLSGQDITSSVNLAATAAGIVIQHPGAIAPVDAFDNIHLS
ncbi:sugar kinase [Paraglaciecola arctica]|uniref:2-dehydro-3-deoxygluconokinase n=1 Tax=Paraglaciecola arctica BSs20135 TaxID=493475 RepID=K6XLT9_9ALTE|nr:sugar kinase [Paraglaciecola arctica]GAC21634.1 2-dehydro-3-deoxygluconokinase [Paraglaciecola arctica BSs20135]